MNTPTDTICAISTAQGTGGIAVIRISGQEAIQAAEKLTDSTLNGRLHFRRIKDLDDVVVSLFRAPHSYTGEDVAEIACHGSIYIQQEIIRRLNSNGIRQAQAGEFTRRAFLNGKLDLTQAEAVADLIASENSAAHDVALNHLKGGIKDEIALLRDKLLKLTSLLELELDFADHEDLEFADRQKLKNLAHETSNRLEQLADSFRLGNAIKNGVQVAIIGPTNAGKSTLLNALAGEERAIVSDTEGTTRDTIEATVNIDGILFRFIDTAGLRQSTDEIERIGINRSEKATHTADAIVAVVEAGEYEHIADNKAVALKYKHLTDLISSAAGKPVCYIYNKADLIPAPRPADTDNRLYLTAKDGNTEPLKRWLSSTFEGSTNHSAVIVSNERHSSALCRAKEAIDRVSEGLKAGLSGELVALDLHDCLDALGEITGEITSEEVLQSVFMHFCIGK